MFRVVKSTELYYIKDDTMIVGRKTGRMENFHGLIGFDMQHFYDTLLELYRKVLTLVM